MKASNKEFIKTHRKLLGAAGVLVAMIITAVYLFTVPQKPVTTIDSYRACENAGGRIGESYPTQCFIDGKSFVNDQTK